MALTELAIKNKYKARETLYRVADGGGLCLEVTPKGSKLWRWRYYFNGKPQMLALGKYPAVSLSDARKARDEARALVDKGKHPTREKKAEKLRKAHEGEMTFEKMARRWLDVKEAGLNEKYHKQCIARMEQHVFPLIGALPITEITIPDVVEVIENIADTGTIETAKRMKQIISQTFRYASQRGICLHNPAADMRDLLPIAEKKHHACIPIDELPDLLKAIERYKGDRLTKFATQLMAHTFVRTNELIGARWEEIDWNRQEWHVPKERMKMRRPHMVPLSRQTLALLKELQKITGDKPYLFYRASTKSKHISNGAILMALGKMGYKKRMTGHGFRSLASTILNEQGYSPDVIERQLAHEDEDKIRSAYNRAEYVLERKKMMQDYADFLEKLHKLEKSDNVLALIPARKAV